MKESNKSLKKPKQKQKTKFKLNFTTYKELLVKNKTAIASVALLLAIVGLATTCAVKAPELKDSWTREKVGLKSYRIVQPNVGGGTGFAIKGPSGRSYLMTNDHVCELSKDQLHLMVIDDSGEQIPRTILHRSDESDLCLLEGMPGVEGLTVADDAPELGDELSAVGHPAGYLTTLTKGQLIMKKDVSIPTGVISIKFGEKAAENVPSTLNGITEEECSKPKNKIVDITRGFFGIPVILRVCLNVTKQAYFTNILSQPGSSGSAVVNSWGEVVAVLFAGDSRGWSILVSLDDIKDFLTKY